MKLLKQAMQLLDNPVTLDTMREWEHLCAQAKGEEAERIGDLYETLLGEASEEVFNAYMEGLNDWAKSQN